MQSAHRAAHGEVYTDPVTLLAWPPLLALISAFSFAVAAVLQKRGLMSASPLMAGLVSVTITAGFIWLLAAVTGPLSLLLTWKILPFLVAGLFAPGLARLFLFLGVHRIGIARSAPLAGTAPLFSVALAILFLGERPTWLTLLGAVAIVVGGALLSNGTRAGGSWRRIDLVLPVLGALSFAIRDNISRWGFREYTHPITAAAAAAAMSLAVIWLFAGLQRGTGVVRGDRAGLWFLGLAGLGEGVGYISLWRALQLGEVSIVSPLQNSRTVFIIILTAIFLRDLERVTWRVVIASGLVVAGVVAILRSGAS